jgi:hypothetical protein
MSNSRKVLFQNGACRLHLFAAVENRFGATQNPKRHEARHDIVQGAVENMFHDAQ